MPYDSETGLLTIYQHSIVEDLNYWASQFIDTMNLNKQFIERPATTELPTYPLYSFINMLFNDEFDNDSYTYLYNEVTSNAISYLDKKISRRLMLYPTTNGYFEPTLLEPPEAIDLFNITTDEFIMLNKLLQYRLEDIALVVDSATEYSTLTTKLSKLIFVYLDAKVNGLTDNLNDALDTINSTEPYKEFLENFYELLVIENVFNIVSVRSVQI